VKKIITYRLRADQGTGPGQRSGCRVAGRALAGDGAGLRGRRKGMSMVVVNVVNGSDGDGGAGVHDG
jgi:hypothetical protein